VRGTDCGTIQAVLSARICKRLRSPGIDSEESIPPTYSVWPGGPVRQIGFAHRSARQRNRFLGSLKRFTNTGSAVYSHIPVRPAARQIFSYKWGAAGWGEYHMFMFDWTALMIPQKAIFQEKQM
jgi:hypothetical protein